MDVLAGTHGHEACPNLRIILDQQSEGFAGYRGNCQETGLFNHGHLKPQVLAWERAGWRGGVEHDGSEADGGYFLVKNWAESHGVSYPWRKV